MDKRTILLLLILILILDNSFSQEHKKELPLEVSPLFINDDIMPVSIKYSNKDIKKVTNDSTFITTYLRYEGEDLSSDSLQVRLRKRGNFRLNNCYFAPVKVKIKKKKAKNTLFEGHKNLKLVLPCLLERSKNDNIIKEYLAYKLYEIVSPYHFRTKLLEVNLEEVKGKGIKNHQIKGFLVEDDKHVAGRTGGRIIKSKIHPLNQLPLASVRNAFFQFMIGNTDFSTTYRHNCKLLFLEGNIIPVPYDFDMAGMVNTSYATVSQINNEQLQIEDVKERMYRGFQREPELFSEVRNEFIANKSVIISTIKKYEAHFENERSFKNTMDYIEEFYEVLLNDKKFEQNILKVARAY